MPSLIVLLVMSHSIDIPRRPAVFLKGSGGGVDVGRGEVVGWEVGRVERGDAVVRM